VFNDRVAHGAGPIVELHRRRLHRASMLEAAAHRPVEARDRTARQPRQPRLAFNAGTNTVSANLAAAASMAATCNSSREPKCANKPPSREPRPLGEAADRQRLEACLAGLGQCSVEIAAGVIALLMGDTLRTIVLFVKPPSAGLMRPVCAGPVTRNSESPRTAPRRAPQCLANGTAAFRRCCRSVSARRDCEGARFVPITPLSLHWH
jgi:hypothetical protein